MFRGFELVITISSYATTIQYYGVLSLFVFIIIINYLKQNTKYCIDMTSQYSVQWVSLRKLEWRPMSPNCGKQVFKCIHLFDLTAIYT